MWLFSQCQTKYLVGNNCHHTFLTWVLLEYAQRVKIQYFSSMEQSETILHCPYFKKLFLKKKLIKSL